MNLKLRIDPLINIIIGEARCDPVLYDELIALSRKNDFTLMHNGILQISDKALESWYRRRELRAV